VKDGKNWKVLNRGRNMMFVGYSENHAKNVFRIYNPVKSRIAQTCNIIWMGRMFHTGREADLTQQLPIVTVPIIIHNKSVDTEIQRLEIATLPLSEERGVKSNSPSEKTNEWVQAKMRYGCTVGQKDGVYNPSTGTTIKWSDMAAAEVDDISLRIQW
jgi:hypothetical protein